MAVKGGGFLGLRYLATEASVVKTRSPRRRMSQAIADLARARGISKPEARLVLLRQFGQKATE